MSLMLAEIYILEQTNASAIRTEMRVTFWYINES